MAGDKIRKSFDPSLPSIRLQASLLARVAGVCLIMGLICRFLIQLDHLLITRVAHRTLRIRRLCLVQCPQDRARGGWLEEGQGRQVDHYQPSRGMLFQTVLTFSKDSNATSLFREKTLNPATSKSTLPVLCPLWLLAMTLSQTPL